MGNNAYHVRPWHLPEHRHATNWATKQMCRAIQRRVRPTRLAVSHFGQVISRDSWMLVAGDTWVAMAERARPSSRSVQSWRA